jgi:NTP pyrophosphatase (non-canonical NTP hydrolase)
MREWSLTDFQALNQGIYGVQNDRNFEAADMASRIHSYITRVLKAVRKNNTEHACYHLAMGFSWSLALANRLHINLDDQMWERFPGYCPYCLKTPCSCKERAEERGQRQPIGERPTTLRQFQNMLRGIYPNNTLKDAAMHLAEESGELGENVEFFRGTHDPEHFNEIVIELVDVVTNICAVASCLGVDLAVEMEHNMGDGCPKCHESPCGCGYTVAKSVSIR